MKIERSAGILLHPSSLPSAYGIGGFGDEAYKFVDFLKKAGQKIWQILPLGAVGMGFSPYQSYSSYAGNALFIDLVHLQRKHLLSEADIAIDEPFCTTEVEYNRVAVFKRKRLEMAWHNFCHMQHHEFKHEFYMFKQNEAAWLNDYSLYMAIKEKLDDTAWYEWPDDIRHREEQSIIDYTEILGAEIEYQKFIQFLFLHQWTWLKSYANDNGVQIIGDLPIYTAYDSTETWVNPELFDIDEDMQPVNVAGVPPDFFSEIGQRWGNPVYKWEAHAANNFDWWKKRLMHNLKLTDILRIDHFRGFEAFWAIPAEEETAVKGEWVKAPGKELLGAIKEEFGDLPLIAEDLGIITKEVEVLRDYFDLPGMKILQFAFDSAEENNYLPHTYSNNCIVYTGTHDNDTTLGWFEEQADDDKKLMFEYLDMDDHEPVKRLIKTAYRSVADVAIIPLQDHLNLDTSARMNTPGTITGNWTWRVEDELLTDKLAKAIAEWVELFGR